MAPIYQVSQQKLYPVRLIPVKKFVRGWNNVNFYYYLCARMNLTALISKRFLKRKLATAVLVTASIAVFATSGGGGKKDPKDFTAKPFTLNSKGFNLRSGYNYRSNNFLNQPAGQQYFMLNTVVTLQKGNATYVL